ncbi:MAG: protoheme IX farnesyltransferase [Ignavibacteriae bacterium]|nr:protoheme IX farnesyltransferase [Ignavibacteriota bacterium]
MNDINKYKNETAMAIEESPLSFAASKISILLELVKFRITVLVSFTTALGYFLASSNLGFAFVYPVVGIFLLACSSAALNQYQEVNTDMMMDRTKNRPIPSGKISRNNVLIISILLLVAGTSILFFKTNLGTLFTGLLTFYWYNAVYTPLKKKTALAIVPGSLVGALPPVAGWLAAGGSLFDIKIGIVALYFFVWQIPHFWLLLLLYGNDFKKGGFPVLTDLYSETFIKRITFVLLIATLVIGIAIPYVGTGLYLTTRIIVIASSALMFLVALSFLRNKNIERKDIVKTFVSINLYTLTLITILSADKLFFLL